MEPSEVLRRSPFLRKMWREIGWHCESILTEQDEGRPGVNPLVKVSPTTGALGQGVWGMTYPFKTTKRFVLKLTLDPFEGPIWQRLIRDSKLLALPGITFTPGVHFVPPKGAIEVKTNSLVPSGRYTVYAVVREAISPTTVRQRNAWEDALDDVRYYAAALIDRQVTVRRWYREVRELAAAFPELAEVARFMITARKRTGIVLADVHYENVGWAAYDLSVTGGGNYIREGLIPPLKKMLKVFDPGHSSLSQREWRLLARSIPENPGIAPMLPRSGVLGRMPDR